MKRRKVKALVVALVLTCLSGMTALAASNACNHNFKQIGASPTGTWSWIHEVPGNGSCSVTKKGYNYYFQCEYCGLQDSFENFVTYHSNPKCDGE